LPYVVIEGHSPVKPGWHRLPISLTDKGESIRTRTVRHIRFGLCVGPREAEAGPELDDSDQGWLYAWQVPTEPPQCLVLSQKEGRSRSAAMKGIGVALLVDLPHRGETAIVWGSSRNVLDSAVERLHLQE
jgi:hypothetical protein